MSDNRYTAKVVSPSDSSYLVEEAREALSKASARANNVAKPGPGALPKKAAQVSPEAVTTALPQVPKAPAFKAPTAKPEVNQTQVNVAPTSPPAAVPTTQALPSFNLELPEPEVKEVKELPSLFGQSDLSVPSDKIRDLAPSSIKVDPQPFPTYINTELKQEGNKAIPAPPAFRADVRSFSDLYPSPLLVSSIMTTVFGRDWVEWEPETVRKELADRNMIDPSFEDTLEKEILFDKIFAIQLLFSHSGYWDFWNMFEKITKAFNGSKVNMQVLQPCHPREMAYSIRMARLLRPDMAQEKFGSELLKYMAACSYQNGFLAVPGDIKDAQPELNKLINTEEYNDLAQALWNAESRLLNMTDLEFDKVITGFEATAEDTKTIQTIKNFSVIQYLREKGAQTVKQLQP